MLALLAVLALLALLAHPVLVSACASMSAAAMARARARVRERAERARARARERQRARARAKREQERARASERARESQVILQFTCTNEVLKFFRGDCDAAQKRAIPFSSFIFHFIFFSLAGGRLWLRWLQTRPERYVIVSSHSAKHSQQSPLSCSIFSISFLFLFILFFIFLAFRPAACADAVGAS